MKLFSILFLALFLTGCATVTPIATGPAFQMPAWEEMCQNQPTQLCEPATVGTVTDYKRLATDVHRQISRVSLNNKIIPWRSRADEVELGYWISGNCTTFSLTAAELMIRQGADPSKILIAAVTTTAGPHMVVVADGWVVDSNQRSIWRMEQMPYKWLSIMRLSEPGKWRKS